MWEPSAYGGRIPPALLSILAEAQRSQDAARSGSMNEAETTGDTRSQRANQATVGPSSVAHAQLLSTAIAAVTKLLKAADDHNSKQLYALMEDVIEELWVEEHLSPILSALMDKLAEAHTPALRLVALRTLKTVVAVYTPAPVVNELDVGMRTVSVSGVRCALVSVGVMLTMQHAREVDDWAGLVRVACMGMVDAKPRVAAAALDLIAALNARPAAADQLAAALRDESMPAASARLARERMRRPGLPQVAPDGTVTLSAATLAMMPEADDSPLSPVGVAVAQQPQQAQPEQPLQRRASAMPKLAASQPLPPQPHVATQPQAGPQPKAVAVAASVKAPFAQQQRATSALTPRTSSRQSAGAVRSRIPRYDAAAPATPKLVRARSVPMPAAIAPPPVGAVPSPDGRPTLRPAASAELVGSGRQSSSVVGLYYGAVAASLRRANDSLKARGLGLHPTSLSAADAEAFAASSAAAAPLAAHRAPPPRVSMSSPPAPGPALAPALLVRSVSDDGCGPATAPAGAVRPDRSRKAVEAAAAVHGVRALMPSRLFKVKQGVQSSVLDVIDGVAGSGAGPAEASTSLPVLPAVRTSLSGRPPLVTLSPLSRPPRPPTGRASSSGRATSAGLRASTPLTMANVAANSAAAAAAAAAGAVPSPRAAVSMPLPPPSRCSDPLMPRPPSSGSSSAPPSPHRAASLTALKGLGLRRQQEKNRAASPEWRGLSPPLAPAAGARGAGSGGRPGPMMEGDDGGLLRQLTPCQQNRLRGGRAGGRPPDYFAFMGFNPSLLSASAEEFCPPSSATRRRSGSRSGSRGQSRSVDTGLKAAGAAFQITVTHSGSSGWSGEAALGGGCASGSSVSRGAPEAPQARLSSARPLGEGLSRAGSFVVDKDATSGRGARPLAERMSAGGALRGDRDAGTRPSTSRAPPPSSRAASPGDVASAFAAALASHPHSGRDSPASRNGALVPSMAGRAALATPRAVSKFPSRGPTAAAAHGKDHDEDAFNWDFSLDSGEPSPSRDAVSNNPHSNTEPEYPPERSDTRPQRDSSSRHGASSGRQTAAASCAGSRSAPRTGTAQPPPTPRAPSRALPTHRPGQGGYELPPNVAAIALAPEGPPRQKKVFGALASRPPAHPLAGEADPEQRAPGTAPGRPSTAGRALPPSTGRAPPGKAPFSASSKARGKAAADDRFRSDADAPAGGAAETGDAAPWEELTPFVNPAKSFRQAMADMEAANKAGRKEIDWVAQQGALRSMRRVVKHHSELLMSPKDQLTNVVKTAGPAIDAIRSSTARMAMILFQDMFRQLMPAMNRELDDIALRLCRRASETSTAGRENFLTIEADRTLSAMVAAASPQRAGTALVAVASHKSLAVRLVVACHLAELVDAVGAEGAAALRTSQRLPSGKTAAPPEPWVAPVFRAGCAFLEEAPETTRAQGKRIVLGVAAMLGGRVHLASMFTDLAPAALQRKVGAVLAAGGGGGDGDDGEGSASGAPLPPAPPAKPWLTKPRVPVARKVSVSAPRARPTEPAGARPPTAERSLQSLSAQPSFVASTTADATDADAARPALSPEPPASKRSSAPRPPRGVRARAASPTQAQLAARLTKDLESKDYAVRIFALFELETLAVGGGLDSLNDLAVTGLFDQLHERLVDGNSKVSVQAMGCLAGMAVSGGGCCAHLAGALITLVPAVAAGLGSGKGDVAEAAGGAADAMVAALDPALMVQHLAHCVGAGPLRSRCHSVPKLLCAMARVAHARAAKLLAKWVVPPAAALVVDGGKSAEGRVAAGALLSALADAMGPRLMDQLPAAVPDSTRARFQEAVDAAGEC
ncbi:hypothetical protein FOA52_000414 [Chlamydomonas sp. UWO 241]|nr:hypothetical protein FOA52_000414 [Chlamydomonas sp. UWO 241]